MIPVKKGVSSTILPVLQTWGVVGLSREASGFLEVSTGNKDKFFSKRVLTCVIFSLLALGLSGASVSKTGCSSGATRSSL